MPRLPLLAVVLAACAGRLPEVEHPCATWQDPGLYALPVEGYQRRPWVYVPATRGPRPAVVVLHGAGANGERMWRDVTRFLGRAERRGFVAVFPNGSAGTGGFTWNAGTCCGASSALDVDDVGFLDAVGASVRERACVDRVVAVGHSNGGMMALRWACEGEQVDAVLSSAGPLLVDRCPGAPVPVTVVHGTADPRVPFRGTAAGAPLRFPPALETARRLARANGCHGAPVVERQGATTCRVWTTCDAPVRACAIEGWRHGWPGGRQRDLGFVAEREAEALLDAPAR